MLIINACAPQRSCKNLILYLFFYHKMSTETVEVFENIGDNIIEFETKEEFDRYYKKNKEFIDNMKTRGLNRKFIIKGFKIGRKKGNILLYPIDKKIKQDIQEISDKNVVETENNSLNLDELEEIQTDIYKRLNNLHQRLLIIESSMK